jgi:Glycosyl hydrolase family 26
VLGAMAFLVLLIAPTAQASTTRSFRVLLRPTPYGTVVPNPPPSTVSGTVKWRVRYFGGTPQRVAFLLDGVRVHRDRTSPFTYLWNTRRVRRGQHVFAVQVVWRSAARSLTSSSSLGARRYDRGTKKRLVRVEAPATQPPATPPVNESLPLISGSVVEGSVLTASVGSWSGTTPIAYAYQWRRCDRGGGGCVAIAAATGVSYSLSAVDVGASLRVDVTATNEAGSASATSAATGLVAAAATTVSSPVFPVAGPAGANTILPSKPGALLGIWPGGPGTTREQRWQMFLAREQAVGRTLDIFGTHYGAPAGGCYYEAPFSGGYEQLAWEQGAYAMVSWTPSATLDQITAGQFDSCFRDVAARFKAYVHPVFLRTMWEFNGNWYPWAYGGDSARFVAAWRRIVDIFRAEGATNVNFVWAPDEGWYRGDAPKSFEAYPGDAYVDWVASDSYNWFSSSAWCGAMDRPHAGWCEFEELFHGSLSAGKSVELDFRDRKPYMVAETGSVEDVNSPGRKGQWFRTARDAIQARFPGLLALVYFDQDLTTSEGVNWSLGTSSSALDGFRTLAQDAYFRTRG